MNGYQRVMKALRFEHTDRVPVVPELIQHNLEVAGKKHGAFSSDPHVMAEVILRGLEAYETDAVYVSSDNYLIAEAMGGKVHLPEDDPPVLLSHAANCIEDAVKLSPLDVSKGRIPVILEATQMLRKQLGDEIFVKTCIDSAPFTAAAGLMGPQEFLYNLIDEPEMCHDFLRLCTESVVRYGIAAAEAGAHGLAFGDSSAVMISRAMFEEFALPYARQAIAELKKRTGLPVFYHVCGDTRHILDLMTFTGADCVEIDSMVPMELARNTAAGRCALEGNVSTIEAFLQGSADDVTREANAIIDLFGNRGGLILSSACEIPRRSKAENVRALTDAAMNYPYDCTGL